MKSLTLLIIAFFLISGCAKDITISPAAEPGKTAAEQQESARNPAEAAIERCVELCYSANGKTDLSNGPCLSNNITPDWVCDIAHSPRQDIDNNPENQCSSFMQGKAHHFVELTPECGFIRFV